MRRETPAKALVASEENSHGTDRIAAGQRAQLATIMTRQMKRIAILLFAITNSQLIYGAQPEHSTSPSRQFVIFGADAKVRGAISGLAEQTKTNLLGLLRQRDDWQTPVVVNLQAQQANAPETTQIYTLSLHDALPTRGVP